MDPSCHAVRAVIFRTIKTVHGQRRVMERFSPRRLRKNPAYIGEYRSCMCSAFCYSLTLNPRHVAQLRNGVLGMRPNNGAVILTKRGWQVYITAARTFTSKTNCGTNCRRADSRPILYTLMFRQREREKGRKGGRTKSPTS